MQVSSSVGLAHLNVNLYLGQELHQTWGPFAFYVLMIM